jgi:hypothetical protein
MGAIITIMASLTGFFTQQIVLFQDCLELKDGASVSIAKTNNYTRSGTSSFNRNPTDFDAMIAAVNVGLIQPVVDFTNVLSLGCSSGNCTFPSTNHGSFSTLGVGHVCEDMTTHIRVVNETFESESNSTVPEFFALDYDSQHTMEFRRVDSGVVLRTWAAPIDYTISTIYMVFRQNNTVYNYEALNCSLFPTVNTYTANIESSKLKEVPIESVPLVPLAKQFSTGSSDDVEYSTLMPWWFSKMVTERTFRDGIEESCTGSENAGPGLIKLMKSIGDPTKANSSDPASVDATWKWWYFPEDCVWSMHEFSVRGMESTFQEIFEDKTLNMGARRIGLEGPAHLRRLFKGGNITLDTVNEQMRDLTTAMTSVIRTNGEEGLPGYLKGEVWGNTTCVDIRWHWISFPATMIGLTGLFLLLVVVANRGVESDRLWKSSFLAVLFCEVELPGNRPVGKEGMAATAKSTSVCLEGKGGTLRLVGQ